MRKATSSGVEFRLYPLTDPRLKYPLGLTLSAHGVLWFTTGTPHLGSMPQIGTFETHAFKRNPLGEWSNLITVGPDSHIWFTNYFGYSIGTVTSTGRIRQYQIFSPGGGGRPAGAVSGPHKNLWVVLTGYYRSVLAEVTTAPKFVRSWTLNGIYCEQGNIALGPGDLLWIGSSHNCQKITRVTGDGQITDFPVAAEDGVGGIAAGPDGNMWFGGCGTPVQWYVCKITRNGIITKYPTSAQAGFITAGPDGRMWFTEEWVGAIGAVSMQGIVTEYQVTKIRHLKQPFIQLGAIAPGPDGNLWFTEWYKGALGEIIMPHAP